MGSRLEKNSEAVRKRIESHNFEDEEGEEYEGSKFGGFTEYFRRKKIKLQNLDAQLRSTSAGNPQIFKGIVCQVNGYTQPSLNDLHHMIVSHGGGFMQYLDGKTTVTHIIAASLTPKKVIEFRRYRIVKPAWIVDSIAAGKVLPWENYRVVDEGVGQKLLGFEGGKIVSQANTQQRGYRDQTNASWYTTQVKQVADDIDDDDGAHFPSTQPMAYNNTASFYGKSSDVPEATETADDIQEDDKSEPRPSNTDSYELTSSLEDALATATKNAAQKVEVVPIADATLTPLPSSESPVGAENLGSIFPPNPRKRSRSVETPSPSKQAKIMTAEEHNAMLLADPHMRKSSTANPDFIKQYYSESRLHHLSAWKADLKARFQQMSAERSPSQQQRQKRKTGARRYIMHVDFDSFFCAVSLKNAPSYVDKPAVVAHGSGNGSEIASCNYPARAFGVKNGMWMKNALKLCPDIKVLPYDFPAYEEASRHFYAAILDVGGIVQSVSVDEALVDISALCISAGGSDGFGINEGSIWREQEKADAIGTDLRARIKEATGCAVSVGIGGNILLAKVALRKAKPAGQHQIKPEEVLDFIGELTVQSLPGVAYSIGGKLEEVGVTFVKDVRSLSKDRLMTILGPKTGEKIWDYSRGIDKTQVGEETIRKSVSAEVNWGIRFISQAEAEEFVQNLCSELHKRLLDSGVKGRHLTMKIMRRSADAPMDPPKNLGHGKCDTFNKSVVLGVATVSADVIGREAISILRGYGFSPGELRGLGIQMTKLEPFKGSGDARMDGSQKRISFGTAPVSRLKREITDDPIMDDPDSPRKPKTTPVHPAAQIIRANEADKSVKKPLNVMGTQFIMPTQIDPKVLAELPLDIRSRLQAQSKSASSSRAQSPVIKSRSESPMPQSETVLPSQLDPDVFDALPEDVRAEVLASYTASHATTRGQSVLPQSPRKVRTLATIRKPPTPTKKRGRGRPPKRDMHSTLTQSNFATARRTGEPSKPTETKVPEAGTEELDPDFLLALPEEMRREVVDEHRRARLARRSNLVTSDRTAARKGARPAVPNIQRKLRLPPKPARPTFTTGELSTLPELRDTLNAWYEEFADDGPHIEDVKAMERYLRRVVVDERDMGKAVGVVQWLAWLVGDGEMMSGKQKGKNAWEEAAAGVQRCVQDAVAERGIGRVDF